MTGAAFASARAPHPARLKRRSDFLRAASGGRVHSGLVSLQVARRAGPPGSDACRVGLTVTRKAGHAVERNRIRRRLREALRAPGLAMQPDHDYVIVARREMLDAPFVRVVAELERLFRDAKAGRIRKSGGSRGKAEGGGSAATSDEGRARARSSRARSAAGPRQQRDAP